MQLKKKNIIVMKKICRKCTEEKEIKEFRKSKRYTDGYNSMCKTCAKEYYNNNKEKILLQYKEYRNNHKEEIIKWQNENKEYFKKYALNRRLKYCDEIRENFKVYFNNNREYFKIKKKEYNKSEKGKETKRLWCNEYNSNNKHVVLWRSLLRRTIVQLKQEKFDTTLNSLGYSAIELKEHIETKWIDGMNWNNYGEWHVDHIRSVATFDSTSLPSEVNALSNLNPMWATNRIINGKFYEGNLNKGKKFN